MFGYKSDEVIGKQLHLIIPAVLEKDKFHKDFKDFASHGTNWVVGGAFELEVKNKEGNKFMIELSVGSYQENGHWQAVGVMRDATGKAKEKANLQDKIDETEKLNKLMIGRELKMIELKEEIKKLRLGTKKQDVEPIKQSGQENTIFDEGIHVEEGVIHQLHDHFINELKSSTLNNETKTKALQMVETLTADSEKHERLLTELSNAR